MILAAAGEQGPQAPMIYQLVPLILLMVIFYFLLIRPQQKKAREHAELVKGVKSGDRVVTSGGVVGIVINVKDKTLTLRSADTKLEIARSAISEITERGGGESKES
jgi:preprotein translocase subunit YajC